VRVEKAKTERHLTKWTNRNPQTKKASEALAWAGQVDAGRNGKKTTPKSAIEAEKPEQGQSKGARLERKAGKPCRILTEPEIQSAIGRDSEAELASGFVQ
jgi:hypothetical protein